MNQNKKISPLQGAMDKDKDKDMENIYMAKHARKLFIIGTKIQEKVQELKVIC